MIIVHSFFDKLTYFCNTYSNKIILGPIQLWIYLLRRSYFIEKSQCCKQTDETYGAIIDEIDKV